jgi:DNA segregation ATPase FtsK/SpoIIIE and related proteins
MGRKKKSKKGSLDIKGAQHSLPSGFWRQVGAVFMVALAIMFVASWFGAGGVVLEWVFDASMRLIGYALYLLPLLLVFLAIETFRNEENRVPVVVVIATLLVIVWFSGIFGLFKNSDGITTGGEVGVLINSGMLSITDDAVAVFIYILLIMVTALFVLSISPITVIKKVGGSLKSTKVREEDSKNAKIMKKVVEDDGSTKTKETGKVKLNAGVPTLSQEERKKSLFGRNENKSESASPEKTEPKSALVAVNDPNWEMPPVDLLEKKQSPADAGDIQQNAEIIRSTLAEFGISVEMEDANIGPKVTQYTFRPPSGTKLTRITALEDNLKLNLAAEDGLRIEAPIPGKNAVGIEVPNLKYAGVGLRSIISSQQWKGSAKPLTFAVGKDIAGESVICDLNKSPHMLIAGTTGSGKSVMINTLVASLLFRNSPSDLRLILIDPKGNEMAPYNDIPHLLTPVITDTEKVVSALKWSVNEMQRRFKLLSDMGAKDIVSYNEKLRNSKKKIPVADEDGVTQEHNEGKMPYIVIVFDEMSDFMMAAKRDIEGLIVRIAQKARAAGIHLVLATQYPKKEIITGLIKGNIPTRIAFKVPEQVNSRVILDQVGAEKLLGSGDMLMLSPMLNKLQRIQGAWVSDDEIMAITDFLRLQSPPQYDEEVIAQPVQINNGKGGVVMDFSEDTDDPMYRDALRLAIETRKISTSMLQTRLRVGYSRASRIIATMEDQGVIGPSTGNSKPREVLVSDVDEIE